MNLTKRNKILPVSTGRSAIAAIAARINGVCRIFSGLSFNLLLSQEESDLRKARWKIWNGIDCE